MTIPYQQCPWCGSTRFVVGYQHHDAMITFHVNGWNGNRAKHLICRQCGTVLLTRVAEPQRYPDAKIAW